MRGLSTWIIGLVASPIGVMVLAALDSTILFSMPGGIDAAVLLLAARGHRLAWIVVVLATAGSMAGAALTFWMGLRLGAHELDSYVPAGRLMRIRRRLHSRGAIGLAMLDLIPPPFPFTPSILAAGALEVDAAMFFATLAACRLLRFGAEAALAVIYGRQILGWLDSPTFHDVVVGLTVLAIALTAVSCLKFVTSSRTARRAATGSSRR